MNKFKKYIGIFAVLLLMLELSACATNASVQGMIYNRTSHTKPRNKSFIDNISVSSVTGGEETNPLWMSKINNANFKNALIDSLEIANLYHPLFDANYSLKVKLMKLHQPYIGFNLTVATIINYQLINNKTKKVVLNKTINSQYTAKISDHFIGFVRLRYANEGAARMNIKKIIQSLYSLRQ